MSVSNTPPDPLEALIEAHTSPTGQAILAEDLATFADPGPSNTKGQSPPQEEMEVKITGDEMTQMIMDILAGKPPANPSSPYAAEVQKRLKAQIAATPVGAAVEIPQD